MKRNNLVITPPVELPDNIVLQNSRFYLERESNGDLCLHPTRESDIQSGLLGMFAGAFMTGLCIAMFVTTWGQPLIVLSWIFGVPIALVFTYIFVQSLAGLLGQYRHYWHVSPDKVEHHTVLLGLRWSQKAVGRIIELQKDDKYHKYRLVAARRPRAYEFTEWMLFNVSDWPDELRQLGTILSEVTGWRYVESNMNFEPSSGGGGG